ncbi:MAG: hypothetical protein ACO4CS_17175 [bacterium]
MITRPDPICLGPILITDTIRSWIDENPGFADQVQLMLKLYYEGDWGQVDEDDWQANIDTIRDPLPGGRLMGSYRLSNREIVWIITDGYARYQEGLDCCYTTILSPDDY